MDVYESGLRIPDEEMEVIISIIPQCENLVEELTAFAIEIQDLGFDKHFKMNTPPKKSDSWKFWKYLNL